MGTGRTDEFRKEAVRIALTSGLSRLQIADDLGVGFLTLNKWVSARRGTNVVSAEDRDLARENEQLRRKVRILKEEIRALKMAIALRSQPRGCIFHSDRGSQYCSYDYQKILRDHGLQSSMSSKGNCHDNAVVETFFKTIKAELVWRRTWEARRQAETGIFQYINGFYNPRRRHSALGGKSPLAFERQAA
jgi:transposase-like protein